MWAISSTTDKASINEQSLDCSFIVNYLENFTTELVVENCKVEFLIDSGSALNILNLKTFNKLNSKNSLKLRKTDTRVLSENKPSLSIKGVTSTLLIENNNKLITKEFYVISTQNKNLLSGHTAIELNLLSIPVNYTQEESDFQNKIKQVPNRLIRKHFIFG